MEDLVTGGLAKAIGNIYRYPLLFIVDRVNSLSCIGISNFSLLKTARLLSSNLRLKPAVNQVELHPYLPQHDLLAFCALHGIHVTAHSPLGGRPVPFVAPNAHLSGPMTDKTILSLAAQYEKTPAQVLLSWAVQRGTSVVPKSVTGQRIRGNLVLFEMREEDVKKVSEIWRELPEVKTDEIGVAQGRRANDPRLHVGFDIYREDVEEPIIEGI